ncbi:hypothetical protein E2562_023105 [Oryza meyeriana var. granulata]|uniref:Uncharacterized protein n=1 Tax=Oryza meyeriana var. granulata TaxID=110450 RepID=A0A6G1E0Q8_9ORYZ|nr:hypothetical protein E2562_023105 [Oryza meyeriana var. granulata]
MPSLHGLGGEIGRSGRAFDTQWRGHGGSTAPTATKSAVPHAAGADTPSSTPDLAPLGTTWLANGNNGSCSPVQSTNLVTTVATWAEARSQCRGGWWQPQPFFSTVARSTPCPDTLF